MNQIQEALERIVQESAGARKLRPFATYLFTIEGVANEALTALKSGKWKLINGVQCADCEQPLAWKVVNDKCEVIPCRCKGLSGKDVVVDGERVDDTIKDALAGHCPQQTRRYGSDCGSVDRDGFPLVDSEDCYKCWKAYLTGQEARDD